MNTKLHLAVDAHGLPVKMIITCGNTADCKIAKPLIGDLRADFLFADKAYDTNDIIDLAVQSNMETVIPSSRRRKQQRIIDNELYKLRHLVENAFLKLKQFRAIATRYSKTTKSFLAECQIAAIMLWIR